MTAECPDLKKYLLGKQLKEFTAIRFALDVGEPGDYFFTYCLCCYILIEGVDAPLKVTSVETDTGYTVFAEWISISEYENRSYELSDNMFFEAFQVYRNLQVDGFEGSNDGDDLLGFHLSFVGGLELHVISGEHYKTDEGYGVSIADEMLLVFEKKSDIERYNLGLFSG